MKIKQEGSIPSWELDVTCEFCNTTLTLEGAEDMYVDSYYTSEIYSIYPVLNIGYFCTCPMCEKKIKVPMSRIRDDILAKIKCK